MTLIADRLRQIRSSETKAMTERAMILKSRGRDIITLSQGELDFETPENIREAGQQAIREGKTRYTSVAGVAPLREAIREKFRRDNGLEYSIDEITVGCGAKQVIFNAFLASLNPGDEVIIPAPCWVSYPEMVKLAGGIPRIVNCREADGFKLQPEALEQAVNRRTKWLMINSPSNPTGAVYGFDELLGLASVLKNHPNVYILSDDIYERLVFQGAKFASIAQFPEIYSRTLSVNGVSKSSAMTGWRVGYGAGPVDLIRAMNTIQGQTSSHTSSISQYAAIEAIIGDRSYEAEFLSELARRRDLVAQALRMTPRLACSVPQGAFYAFVSCAGAIGLRTPDGREIADDVGFSMYLLEQAGVAVVPGSGFLASPYIRVSFASSREDLRVACDRIAAACAALTAGRHQ